MHLEYLHKYLLVDLLTNVITFVITLLLGPNLGIVSWHRFTQATRMHKLVICTVDEIGGLQQMDIKCQMNAANEPDYRYFLSHVIRFPLNMLMDKAEQ